MSKKAEKLDYLYHKVYSPEESSLHKTLPNQINLQLLE